MTDHINALIVTLERDVRDDDLQSLSDAIQHFRGVLSVKSNIADLRDHIAIERAKHEIKSKLWKAFGE